MKYFVILSNQTFFRLTKAYNIKTLYDKKKRQCMPMVVKACISVEIISYKVAL